MATIELWEDNAGQLYLHRSGDDWAYAHLEMLGGTSTFANDAADFGGTSWDVETTPWAQSPQLVPQEMDWVATWQGGKVSAGPDRPGEAARLYLGADAPQEES